MRAAQLLDEASRRATRLGRIRDRPASATSLPQAGLKLSNLKRQVDHISLFKRLVLGQFGDAQHRSLDTFVDRVHVLIYGRWDVLLRKRGLGWRLASCLTFAFADVPLPAS